MRPLPGWALRRRQYSGVLTNNVVHDRLAPEVREEPQKGVPRKEAGRPAARYSQKLGRNTGYPELREVFGSVVTLMKLRNKWNDVMEKLDLPHPEHGGLSVCCSIIDKKKA